MTIPAIFGKKEKILFVGSESAPYAKIGGLGEVMRSLPKALRSMGYDARIMIPKYASVLEEKFPMDQVMGGLSFVSENKDPHGLFVSNVLRHKEKDGGIAYFLENMEYFEKRANVYGYSDDTTRWLLLCHATLEFIRQSREWVPDIIVASDWQAGFIPDLIKRQYKNSYPVSDIKTLFAIHNIGFQGTHDHRFVSETDYDSGREETPEFDDSRILKLNGIRRGVMWSDLIITVSPSYAKEILTPEYGEGLSELLEEKRGILFGVLNGIDYDSYNPETDRRLSKNYSVNSLNKRLENKKSLQEKFGLETDSEKFIVGIVSRMDEQKGFSLIEKIAEPLFANLDFQMVVVGGGDNKYREYFQGLSLKYPKRFGGHYFYDETLPRMIFGGADAILIPSRFEPSGLVQMEAMRYGAIPIVRKTGGLADSVDDFDRINGNGFVFDEFDPYALLIAIIRANETFRNKELWKRLQKNAMRKDFSWKSSAKEYAKLFDVLMTGR